MDHDVFKDLVPSYLENLTSKETNKQMEEHMKQCADCREYLKGMQEDLLIERNDEHRKEKKNIDYLKKVRSKNRKKIFTVVMSLLIIFIIICIGSYFLFAHMWIADENDVRTTIQRQDNIITLSFQTKHDNRYLLTMENSENSYTNEIIIYEKWNDFSEAASLFKDGSEVTYTFLDKNTLLLNNGEQRKLTDEDVVHIRYKDNTEKIPLKDLYNATNNN
ncbi:zf-HC2 domain-containing protein [Heyndrickxia acidiproducens]|uniref:zf-HC2 domain-containing protein n=1 Tax=Heyndrickxia acidiproducens TaxID=1121084 RepID=UPI00035C9E94|nr:zf-HC2 domain-containing protein [Heyndrickxia acidiproducens]